jgi:hypothetical protein
MSAQDPFYAVRDSIEAEVQSLRVKFGDWKLLLNSTDTYADVKFRQKHEEVTRDLKKCSEMVAKVRMAVEKTEKNRTQFSHIDDREMGQRKAFVDRVDGVRAFRGGAGAQLPPPPSRPAARRKPATSPPPTLPSLPPLPCTAQTVINLRAEFFSPEVKGKLSADERRALAKKVAREAEDSARGSGAHAQGNAEFLRGAGSEQQQIRRNQDVVLDKMSHGLDTLNEMALAIDSELKDQEKMVDDIDQKTDEAQGKMDGAIKGIEKLLKTKNNCQLATIAALVIIFVIGAREREGRPFESPAQQRQRTQSHAPLTFPPLRSYRHRAHVRSTGARKKNVV